MQRIERFYNALRTDLQIATDALNVDDKKFTNDQRERLFRFAYTINAFLAIHVDTLDLYLTR